VTPAAGGVLARARDLARPLAPRQRRAALPPPLPPATVELVPGRGDLLVRRLPGPPGPGRPPLLLLHGWTLAADLNWFPFYAGLARHGPVVAPDLRGHGRGIRSEHRFTLDGAADDAAGLLGHLGLGPAVVVGYSMGSSIGLLLWRRHPEAVAGLVLMAGALQWRSSWRDRLLWSAMSALDYAMRLGPPRGVTERYLRQATQRNPALAPYLGWLQAEAGRSHPPDVAAAGRALSAFDARSFAGRVDVPTAVVVTTGDRLVGAARQRDLAAAIPGAAVVELATGHDGWLVAPGATARALDRAVAHVQALPSS